MNAIIAKSLKDLPSSLEKSVVAIGNFDGVHRGHQAVLAKAIEIAKAENMHAIALTFEPHPRTYFAPQNPVFRLTEASMKAKLISSLGIDIIFQQDFDKQFSSQTADEFVDGLLFKGLKASHVVTGYDFHFGKNRSGTPQYLVERVKGTGRTIDLIEPFNDENGDVISSSRIRSALGDGDIAAANGLLGFTFRIEGEVIDGQKIGRTIGYPTANIELPANASLAHGVYGVRVERKDGSIYDGVASFGRRPTFDNGKALFETFLFDFDGDLYGENLTIYIHTRLRNELKFDTVGDLIVQMDKDSEEAKSFLQTVSQNQGIWPLYSANS